MEYPIIYQIDLIYYPVLAVIGIPVNLSAVLILSRGRCGLSKCITQYLLAMAVSDLAVVIIHVILHRINIMYLTIRFLFLTPVCIVNFVGYKIAVDCSVWFTVALTSDRFVAICFQNIQSKYCTKKTSTVVIITILVLSCLRTIPFYYMFEPVFTVNNVAWHCVVTMVYITSHLWRIFEWIDSFITPLLPILLILSFNALTIRHIILANNVRKTLHRNNEFQNDAELENRRKSMILLFTISANFIVLWMVHVVHSVKWPVLNFFYTDKFFSNQIYVVQQVGYMFQLLSCCTNTCIYVLTQRKFREEMKSDVKYLFTLNGKLCQQH